MSALSDSDARLRALTSHNETLIVEAAAGTGRTSMIAGRVTLMLAAGNDPASIAAITFTELAASELAARVERYVGCLLEGDIPAPLSVAFPNGVSEEQRRNLTAAATRLDQVSTATIHAFCQKIILSYAVEADIDPGARVMDADAARSAFGSVFSQWFKSRLGVAAADDAVGVLSRSDPRKVAEVLNDIARFRLRHRDAKALPADLSGRPDDDLRRSVDAFARWYVGTGVREWATGKLAEQFESLAAFYDGAFATPPDAERLWLLSGPPKIRAMRWPSAELERPRLRDAWVRAGKDRGEQLYAEFEANFSAVDHAYRAISGKVATALVATFADAIDEVMAAYRTHKRDAAVLDFDDLLECARELVRTHDGVRRALGDRYRHVLIDEFQDTDPVQAEIFFRIAADAAGDDWREVELRAGALFLVGDPKQAIYRFRGADVATYAEACNAVLRRWPDSLVHIVANFRSRPPILEYVNRCFSAPLSGPGQPGYVALEATLNHPAHDLPCAARATVETLPKAKANALRQAEADVVAETCARLIGSMTVMDDDGQSSPLRAGGIALLSPTHTDLWYYERALSERGLPFVSQAGRGFFRRQETQDLLALARTLADSRDTLAFGALMRGPLVGLTEEELLDITHALDGSMFTLNTDPATVGHAVARQVLETLRRLRSISSTTTPYAVLSEAVGKLNARSIIASRGGERVARAFANVETFLERARAYGVRGLKAFARDLGRDWAATAQASDGRLDASGDAIEIVTIHSAKGLEWPVVIPINTATRLHRGDPFVHRFSDNTLHWLMGDVAPPELASARHEEVESLGRERERLWYVACTRARELLIVPWMEHANAESWSRVVDLGIDALPEWDIQRFERWSQPVASAGGNLQTAETFAIEADRIREVAEPWTWVTPSLVDDDRMESLLDVDGAVATAEVEDLEGAGRLRGLVLHKLVEEILLGVLGETEADLTARAGDLVDQLATGVFSDAAPRPAASELARTVLRTLALPEVSALRPRMTAEVSLFRVLDDRIALSGRADAVAVDVQGRIEVVIDWKSDVAPSEDVMADHAAQLGSYLLATGALRGAVVYMTSGRVRWIHRPSGG